MRGSGIAVSFVAAACFWGASFMFIKVGIESMSPLAVTWSRMLFGAVALLILMTARRARWPRDPAVWGHLAVASVLFCVVPFSLFGWAEQSISSGLASILNATTPIMAAIFAAFIVPGDRLTRSALVGIACGIAGVVTIIGPGALLSGHSSLSAELVILGATSCYGLAFAYQRRFVTPRGLDGLTVAAVMVGMGALIMLALSPVAMPMDADLSPKLVGSMFGLGVFGTGIAYWLNTRVIDAWGAANAAAVTYLIPFIGVVLGIVVLSEPLRWNQPLGGLVVVLGILVMHGRLRWRPAAAA